MALGRVLRNLLDNAIRHSPTGGAVSINTKAGESSVVLEVVDDGPGFDDDFAPRAFERFTQADVARSGQGGAGLGLAIAQTLVQAHSGRITIESGPGGRVVIELPTTAHAAQGRNTPANR